MRARLFEPRLFGPRLFSQSESILQIIIGTGPVDITFSLPQGQSFSPGNPARVIVSRPGYVRAPHTCTDRTVTVIPVGIGVSTVTLQYNDPVNGPSSVSRQVAVVPND